jgi:uncharacterized membrane protein
MNDHHFTLAKLAEFLSSKQAELSAWFLVLFGSWTFHDWLSNMALAGAFAMSVSNLYLNYLKAQRLKRSESAETGTGEP